MKKMLLIFTICILTLPLTVPVNAENIYVAQTARGSDNGANADNAHSILWLNNANNWGAGVNKVSPGDAVHLVGILTSPLVILGSGTSGNPITLQFESNAKFSAEHWNQGRSNGDAAIYGSDRSYIVIDGGTNGLIECTNNGTQKKYQLHSVGIQFDASSNIEVRNLTVHHIYDRVQGTDNNAVGGCIQFRQGASSISVHHNTVYDANVPIYLAYGEGNSNIAIYSNTGGRAGEGVIVFAAQSPNCILSDVMIYGNSFTKGFEWSGQAEIHTNLIHLHAVQSNSSIRNLKVFSNTFKGFCGSNSTSLVFLEGELFSSAVYNNLFIRLEEETGSCGNGMLVVNGNSSLIANNTFYKSTSGAIGISILGTNMVIKNNLFYNIGLPVTSPYSTTTITSIDYNIYYSFDTQYPLFNWGSYSQRDFLNWRNALQAAALADSDQHSTTNKPMIDSSYAPTSDDKVAVGKGTNLSAVFSTDLNGKTRPSSGSWDIGAFQMAPSTPLAPPQGVRIQ